MKAAPVIEMVTEEKKTDIQKKEEHITNYIKALVAVEEEMEPFKEHRRDLKKNYIDNEWLSRDEISLAVKAYRLMKDDIDMEQLMDFYDRVSKTIN